jgi:pyruvate kinase
MRKTKIICTIGPRTCGFDQLKKLAEGGMNIARINMSHGDHEWHKAVVKHIRTLNEKYQFSIAIMLDTKGPEVRTGDLKREINLSKGDRFTFTVRREPQYPRNMTEISYDGFVDDVKVGDILLIDGGIISFKVLEKTATDIICEARESGTLSSRRHINVRGKSARLPSILQKDWKDIDFGIKENVDFIALSFVRNSAAIKELKKYLSKKKSPIGVVAKIESAASIPHIKAIIKASDGVMVARGDLGSELPFEEVPLIQERIVNLSREIGKPVIVATHLLESMIVYPTPTRAEVTDISEAVKEKTDAIMLSGETANGNYPFKALSVMDIVARRIELKLSETKDVEMPNTDDVDEQIVRSATLIGNNIDASAILVFTRRGYMASLISRCRPNSPIYAFTNTPHVRRKLNIYWGIQSYRIDLYHDPEKTIQTAIELLRKKKLIRKNQSIIIVSDILVGEDLVDTVQVRNVK